MSAGKVSEPRAGNLAPVVEPEVAVWDPLVRVLHGALIVLFAVAVISGDDYPRVHEWAGYGVLAIVALRIVWGLVGPKHARFGYFVVRPRRIIAYARDMARGHAPRFLGHNPLGGLMVVALLGTLLVISGTGVAMTVEPYSTWESLKEAHEIASNAALALVGLHVAGVLLSSLLHGENLTCAMITGRKRRS